MPKSLETRELEEYVENFTTYVRALDQTVELLLYLFDTRDLVRRYEQRRRERTLEASAD